MKKMMLVINALFSGTIFMAPKCALWAIGGMSVAAFLEQSGVESSTYKLVALVFVLVGIFSLALSVYNGIQDDKKSEIVAAQWKAEAAAAEEERKKLQGEYVDELTPYNPRPVDDTVMIAQPNDFPTDADLPVCFPIKVPMTEKE